MNYQRLLIALIFFIRTDLLALGQIICQQNNGNYTNNSPYSVNLNATLSSLYTNVKITGFYNASVGEGIDRANALVLCRGDVQLNACRDCIQNAAADLLQTCPNQKQAIRWDEPCMVRYSNATMLYGAMETSPKYYWWNLENATSVDDRFENNLRKLLEDLRDKAAGGGSLRKVAGGNATAPNFKTIFALVQCTPDLSPENCTSCLINAAEDIPLHCDGKIRCRVLLPSCNLRFAITPFFNETRLQELEPASLSPSVLAPPPPTLSSPGRNDDNARPGKKDNNTTTIIIIFVVSLAVCIILAVCGVIFLRRRKIKQEISNTTDKISTVESLQYDFGTIRAATNDFDDVNKLGQGGFGVVYKGKLQNNEEMAVKRLSKDSGQGIAEFKNEVLLMAKLQHRNLVRLLGFSQEGAERLLVYEFAQNASLDKFIFDPIKRSLLDWDKRYKIIRGVARGLMYLHEDSRLKIIHRDLKASNILLDGDMNPKIADFGMARLFGQDETQANTSKIVGTSGYMSPEYMMHGQFSIKSDVFSFGVLILEILSGQRNSCIRNGENVEDLLTLTWKRWSEGTAADLIDHVLLSNETSYLREMLRSIHIGLLCVQENAANRPTMNSIVLMLGSSNVTLSMPSEPAFYVASRNGPEFSEKESNSNKASNIKTGVSEGSSQNEMSVTELYPR